MPSPRNAARPRRRRRGPLPVALTLAALAASLAACSTSSRAVASSDQGCTWTVGALGGETGRYDSLVRGYLTGVRVAVDEINASRTLACRLVVRVADTEGDPAKAGAAAVTLLNDPRLVVAMPFFSGEALAAGPVLDPRGVPVLSIASATVLTQQGWHRFFRLSASDAGQGRVAAEFIAQQWHGERVAVVSDGSTYGHGLATIVAEQLGARTAGQLVLHGEDTAPVVAAVRALKADVVYYGGYAPEAGALLAALRNGGVDARFMSGDGADDRTFGDNAGRFAADGVITCPCGDPRQIVAAAGFVTSVEQAIGTAPPAYSADNYDGVHLVADALRDATAQTSISAARAMIVHHLRTGQPLEGISKTYRWDARGELVSDPLETVWIYTWSSPIQRFTAIGRAADFLTR